MATRKRAPKWAGPWVTTKQAAEHLGVSVQHLRRMRINRNGPPCSPYGRGYRYPLDGLNHWAAHQGDE
jgi:excisionase family DNA binding protein